jgi:hypothetical protein
VNNDDRQRPPRPTLRTLVTVAAWGAITAGIAYLISRGSIPFFIAAILVIGVAQRVIAVRVARRRGSNPPPWWKI